MKTIFTILILIVSLGAGCVETPSNTDVQNETENLNAYSLENQNSAKERILADGEIGFTLDNEAFGDFTVKYIDSPKGAAYVGSFAETDDFYFYVSDPNVSVGRGSWLGDTVGYSQKEEIYYLRSKNGFEEEIPEYLVVGEYEAVNGKALLIKGEPATGPSSWPAEGMYAVILNIPNGPVSGGSFHQKTIGLSEKELMDFIATITFTK